VRHVACYGVGTMTTNPISLGVYGRTDIGKVREHNEDAFVIANLMGAPPIHAMQRPVDLDVGPEGVLLAVSDGMGGAQAGEVARALVLQALRRARTDHHASAAESALTASVKRSDGKVWDLAVGTGRAGAGPTLAVVMIESDRAFVAEIGDAHAYVLRGSRLVQPTGDQGRSQLFLDALVPLREKVETFAYRNVILQAIGTHSSVVVTLCGFTLRHGDRLLLCSDGLSSKVKDEEMSSILSSSSILDVACAQLVELANARGGEDNVTVVLAEMHGHGLSGLSKDRGFALSSQQAFEA